MKNILTALLLICASVCVAQPTNLTSAARISVQTDANGVLTGSSTNFPKVNANQIIAGLNASARTRLGTNLLAGYLPAWALVDPSSIAGGEFDPALFTTNSNSQITITNFYRIDDPDNPAASKFGINVSTNYIAALPYSLIVGAGGDGPTQDGTGDQPQGALALLAPDNTNSPIAVVGKIKNLADPKSYRNGFFIALSRADMRYFADAGELVVGNNYDQLQQGQQRSIGFRIGSSGLLVARLNESQPSQFFLGINTPSISVATNTSSFVNLTNPISLNVKFTNSAERVFATVNITGSGGVLYTNLSCGENFQVTNQNQIRFLLGPNEICLITNTSGTVGIARSFIRK